jgi:general secretion pathway protein C
LGLRNGDVVRRLAGYELVSPDKALEAYASLRGAKSIPVELLRAGKPLTLIYEIQP